MKIEGHSALVTGGASGLGEATARALSAAGARVAILDHNIEGARRVASELGGLALQCDVSSADSAEAAVAEAASRHGPARILINCAGVAPAQKILSEVGIYPAATDVAAPAGLPALDAMKLMQPDTDWLTAHQREIQGRWRSLFG